MIKFGSFSSHSGLSLPFKIDLDCWTDKDWESAAKIIASKFFFSRVHGVPEGGLKLCKALIPFCKRPATAEEPSFPILLVDDVLTTGSSMIEWRKRIAWDSETVLGIVIFSRGPCPNWIWPLFILQEWTQCRGTGIG